MPPAPLYVVLNAGSGHDDTETTARAIAEVFNAAGRPHEIFRVDDPKQLGEVAQQAVAKAMQSSGTVVAAGGDGTLNAVAQATLGSGCTFGVIPSGTFNYFGRTHGISSDTSVAARALLTARVQNVQVGLVNDRVFLVNASIGMYPQLLEDREEQKHRHGRSRLVAAWAALVTIFRGYRPMLVKLESDGQTHQLRTLTLFITNNRLQLEQMGLEAGVVEEERKLAAIVLGPVSKLSLLWLALQGALGRLHEANDVQRFSLTRLLVTPSNRLGRRLKVATDGEVTRMKTPIEFSVAPEPLQLLVPIDAVPETAKR